RRTALPHAPKNRNRLRCTVRSHDRHASVVVESLHERQRPASDARQPQLAQERPVRNSVVRLAHIDEREVGAFTPVLAPHEDLVQSCSLGGTLLPRSESNLLSPKPPSTFHTTRDPKLRITTVVTSFNNTGNSEMPR